MIRTQSFCVGLQPKVLAFTLMAFCFGVIGCSSGKSSSDSTGPTQQAAPALTSLSATSALVGSPSFVLTVTGQNFLSSSVAQFNGVSLITVVNSSTQLTATVPASSLTATGAAQVTVVDPSPLSLTSNSLTFTINPIPPTISSINPTSAIVNTGPITIALYGQNFGTGATVAFSSTNLTIKSQTAAQIQATVPASLLTATGTFPITVSNPAPNAATSAPIIFTVQPVPVASITSLSPSSVIAGAAAFSLQVSGQAFVSGSTIQLNGTAVTTSFLSSGILSATVPDTFVATAGTVAVTVVSPGTGGSGPVTSNSVNLTVNPLPAGEFIVNQVANDLVWDPQHSLIYASVPSSAPQYGNDIVAIDPTTGKITKSVYAGSEPDLLAISDDGQFLYVGLDGSSNVQRFTLPAMTPDILVSLGGSTFYGLNTAIALDVAAGAPHTWMVSVGDPGTSPEAIPGITVFDDATARPTSAGRYTSHGGYDLLLGTAVWGKDTTVIYGANNESTGFDFYVLPVTSTGIPGATIVDYPGALQGFGGRIHFDKTTGYVFADNGPVLNPATGKAVGTFSTSGVMVPDGSIGKAFFMAPQFGSTTPAGTITSYDINHFTPITSIVFPNVTGGAERLIRWGTNGLAFNTITTNYNGSSTTKTGKVFILSGSFVQ